MTTTPSWIQDPWVLFRDFSSVIPTSRMSVTERYNATIRMILVVMAALYFSRPNMRIVFGGLTVISILTAQHVASSRRNTHVASGSGSSTNLLTRDANDPDVGHAFEKKASVSAMGGDRLVQNDTFGRPVDDSSCRMPEPHNPFMNWTVGLYTKGEDPLRPACSQEKENVVSTQRQHFNRGLVRNSTDMHEKENSQRQFFTTPSSTAIPDTRAFAEFLYTPPPSCKTTPAACPTR
jgi:hypothetical protein